MHPSMQIAMHWQRLKHTGHLLLFISLLILLALFAAGIGLLHPASFLFGSQMAGTNGDIHIGSIAGTNGNIHIGGMAGSNGDIHIGG